jgi:hypothetical protein
MSDHDAGAVAEAWTHVENGLITRIEVTFDPRPLAPPGG